MLLYRNGILLLSLICDVTTLYTKRKSISLYIILYIVLACRSLVYTCRMRIASLTPGATELLFALGCGHEVIFRDADSDAPEEAQGIPIVVERDITADDVDLAFTDDAALASRLRVVKIDCIHFDPQTLEELYLSIRSFGTILNCDAQAQALSFNMRQGMNDVQKRARLLPRQPSIHLAFGKHPQMVPPFTAEIVRMSGGKLVEDAASADMIVHCTDGIASAKNTIQNPLLLRPGPRLVEGAQRLYGWIFQALH